MRYLRGAAYVLTSFGLALPAFAAPTFAEVVNGQVVRFVDVYLVPLMYALAFLFFIVGVVRYFFTGGEENRTVARAFMIWSLVGMVVLFGLWGIVQTLVSIIPTS